MTKGTVNGLGRAMTMASAAAKARAPVPDSRLAAARWASEAELAAAWARCLPGSLRLLDGRPIQVIFPGVPGPGNGPDFRGAVLDHHHMLHLTDRITGGIMWANLHLLFWLSLVPFVTGWMGENHFAPLPTAVYGVVLLCSGVSFTLLARLIIAHQGPHSRLRDATGRDLKGALSMALYAAAIPLAFVNQLISDGIYLFVAMMWLVPDRRIESRIGDS